MISAEILYWGSPQPGHIALRLWDTDLPERGFYLSTNFRTDADRAIARSQTMDYAQMFHAELATYGKDCLRVKLPPIAMDLWDFVGRVDKQELKKDYSLISNNCAHFTAHMLMALGVIHNPNIVQRSFLTPTDVYNVTQCLHQEEKHVSEFDYSFALIKEGIRGLGDISADLYHRGHLDAYRTINELAASIESAIRDFSMLENKTLLAWRRTQETISAAIAKADPVLCTHRGTKKVVGNIMLGILMCGVIYVAAILIKGAITGKFLFFSNTATSKKTHQIRNIVKEAQFVEQKEVKLCNI